MWLAEIILNTWDGHQARYIHKHIYRMVQADSKDEAKSKVKKWTDESIGEWVWGENRDFIHSIEITDVIS